MRKDKDAEQAVVEIVVKQLERLLPETCDHPPEDLKGERMLEGTNLKCTEDLYRCVSRIPIPFVREMVVKRVEEYAKDHSIDFIDLKTYEEASTF